jgi:L-2-hydroxyglutarate oxidase LhgO
MPEIIDSVVVGAGVVGLAVGRALAESGREVIVLEKNARFGEETSSRNSEVIHAGLYYAAGSLKARLCVQGKQALYEYCAAKGVGFERCGKLIVAIDAEQTARLEDIARSAARNGVHDLERLDAAATAALEPQVRAAGALLSPSTGIVDGHGLMLSLVGDIERGGGHLALRAELCAAVEEKEAVRLFVAGEDGEHEFLAHTVVNAAGLSASGVAASFGDSALAVPIPPTRYAKGSYFMYKGPSPFRRLIYPLPIDGGLGVHATLDLAGRVRFGPDVEWVEEIDYRVDPSRADAFYAAVQSYFPGLPRGSLTPGYAGVRPKLNGPGETPADFTVLRSRRSPASQAIHLLGFESPGLTAALAIGRHVADLARSAGI